MTFDRKGTRGANLAHLKAMGFVVSPSLPVESGEPRLRPVAEIAGRLAALNALFVFATAPAERFPTEAILENVRRNGLGKHLTEKERAVLAMDREGATEAYGDGAGWRTENALALAWVLGGEATLAVDGTMIDGPTMRRVVTTPSPIDASAFGAWAAGLRARDAAEVAAMEDLFYCAHNAARSAQVEMMQAKGRPVKRYATVPQGFDPVVNGGVIHERRHALTWAVSPGVSWDETDLDT